MVHNQARLQRTLDIMFVLNVNQYKMSKADIEAIDSVVVAVI